MKNYFTFPNFVKLFWFATATSLLILPTTTGAIVALGLASSIIVFQEWLNTQGVSDEILQGLIAYRDAVNQRVSLTEEAVEGVAQATRHNTQSIASHSEELSRIQTASNFKELN